MKRLQIHIEEELDEALGALAAELGTSKAALIRAFVADRMVDRLRPQADALDELLGVYEEDSGDVDALIYGP
jgi:predicted transcriptional regulator